MPHTRTTPQIFHRSKALRRALTPAERTLWARLRNHQLNGLGFRRQHALGPYIVDFCCPETKCIVEVDGPSHAHQAAYDAARTAWLEERGWRVLRVTNADVRHRLPAVLAAIQSANAPFHIYLSPHLDDAVLSCGGMMAQQIRRGERVRVITVCAGDPPPGPLSPFAQSLHERWGTLDHAAALRRAEDVAALNLLGAEVIQLDVPDCIYRAAHGEPLYASESAIFGELHPGEAPLLESLAAEIRALGPGQVYAPYTLGHHVDHQLTRRAAEKAGAVWAYYEDYPYAARAGVPPTEPHTAEVIPLEEADLAAKIHAIAQYSSQISSFWGSLAEMKAALRAFALSTGAGVLAERIWRLP